MFEEALTKVLGRLDSVRANGLLADYALIGGFAVAAWGVPRATHDIDFAIAIGSNEPQALAAFMEGRYDAGEPDDPLKGVIRATVTVSATSVPVQLVFLPAIFTDAIFEQIEMLSIMNHHPGRLRPSPHLRARVSARRSSMTPPYKSSGA